MPASETTVLIADGRTMVREMLAEAIASRDGFSVVGRAATLESAVELAGKRKPDIVVYGARTLGRSAEEVTHGILLASASSAVVVLGDPEDDEALFEALEAGAVGFTTTAASIDELADNLRSALARETVLPARLTGQLLERLHVRPRTPASLPRRTEPSLTDREREILQLLTHGLGNAEIARALGVSANTVKNHLHSIYRKLGVSSRGQAFATAMELGLAS